MSSMKCNSCHSTSIVMINERENYRLDKTFDTRLISYNLPSIPGRIIPGYYTFCLGNRSRLRVEIECDSIDCEDNIQYTISLQSPKGQEDLFETCHLKAKVSSKTPKPVDLAKGREIGQETVSYPITASLVQDSVSPLTLRQIWWFCYILFSLWPEQEFIALDLRNSSAIQYWLPSLCATRLAGPWPEHFEISKTPEYASTAALSRADFWQGAGPLKMGGWVPALDEDRLLQDTYFLHTTDKTNAEGSKLTMREVKENVPLYQRFLPEFGICVTFLMQELEWEASDLELAWVLPSKRLDFICQWDCQPFASVSMQNGDFLIFGAGTPEEENIRAEVQIRSIIHVSFNFCADTVSFFG